MKITAALAAIGLVVGLSACETATPYQPLRAGSEVSGGFTDQRLDQNHFRVTFRGNSMTSRERVETYLLYRAAELTLQNGDDWFAMVDRNTERNARTYVEPDPFYHPWYGAGFGYWRPYWRYRSYGGAISQPCSSSSPVGSASQARWRPRIFATSCSPG